eukprot:SAG31_NODE_862_length_11416_cov_8.600336_11_plen_208_part_00
MWQRNYHHIAAIVLGFEPQRSHLRVGALVVWACYLAHNARAGRARRPELLHVAGCAAGRRHVRYRGVEVRRLLRDRVEQQLRALPCATTALSAFDCGVAARKREGRCRLTGRDQLMSPIGVRYVEGVRLDVGDGPVEPVAREKVAGDVIARWTDRRWVAAAACSRTGKNVCERVPVEALILPQKRLYGNVSVTSQHSLSRGLSLQQH